MGTIITLRGRDRRPRAPVAPTGSEAHRPMRPAVIVLVTAAVLGVVITLVTTLEQRAERSIRHLPPAVRQEVYERALTEIRGVCLQPVAAEGALREHCLEQAQFLQRFSECTSECRAAVSRVQPPPARR